MRWLHRLVDHYQQLFAQLVQINFTAQGSAKGSQRLLRVILMSIETAINEVLNSVAQGLNESSYCQCRDHNNHRLRSLPREQPDEALQSEDEAHVERYQDACQQDVYQRAIDQNINIVQTIAQDRSADRKGQQERQERIDDLKQGIW